MAIFKTLRGVLGRARKTQAGPVPVDVSQRPWLKGARVGAAAAGYSSGFAAGTLVRAGNDLAQSAQATRTKETEGRVKSILATLEKNGGYQATLSLDAGDRA